MGLIAAPALALAGCQSGGQSDLVTRELRMQEDQIYAMEDYLSQYQQLLCELRAENADLKREIANLRDGEKDGTLPAPASDKESSRVRTRTPARGPSFRAPERAPERPDQLPMPPETELIEPDVPPVQETAPEVRGADRGQGRPGSPQGDVARKLEVRGQNPDSLDDSNSAPAKFVQIRGEVVVNESGGGPRLAVDVEAMSAMFEPTHSVGSVSLMLLAPKKDGPPQSLARWDYSAMDAQALLRESPEPGTMQFHLELPANTVIDRPTEFWVRMMPHNGDKVLGHVRLDLSRPTRFESTKEGTFPQDGWSDRKLDAGNSFASADHDEVTPAIALAGEDGWSLARPDRKGQLGVGSDLSGGWRAAIGPLPEVAASVKPVVQQAAFVETVPMPPAVAAETSPVSPTVPAATRTVPVWTPVRGDKSAEVAKTRREGRQASAGPVRPTWAPVR